MATLQVPIKNLLNFARTAARNGFIWTYGNNEEKRCDKGLHAVVSVD